MTPSSDGILMVPQKKLCCRLKDITVGTIAAAFALLLIIFLDLCKTIVFERRTLLGREIVKPRIVVAKDRPLDLAVRGPSGLNPYFFCISSGISSRRRASICHWGTRPDRI